MGSWGNQDQYSDAPSFVTSANTGETGQEQYGNTVFGVDAQECTVSGGPGVGWVKRVALTGNKSGRVQKELLVALSKNAFKNASGSYLDATDFANTAAEANTTGSADDTEFPDA